VTFANVKEVENATIQIIRAIMIDT